MINSFKKKEKCSSSGNVINYIFFVSFVVLNISRCVKSPTNDNQYPIIENDSLLTYSKWNNTIFIAAQIRESQEYSSSSITLRFRLQKPDNSYLDSILYDDGINGKDIIKDDKIYSFLVDSSFIEPEGTYEVKITMEDTFGLELDLAEDSIEKLNNYPPEIYLLDVPDTVEKGDTALLRIRVCDPQGYSDIDSVFYSVRLPDGEVRLHRSWFLSDSGKTGSDSGSYGDKHEIDGIFSMRQPFDKQGKLQGLYTFYFTAKDKHGAISDTLPVSVIKPGVTINEPNFTKILHFGNKITIRWESAYINELNLEYTLNYKASTPKFHSIAENVSASSGSYQWTFPSNISSSDLRKIKIYDSQKPSRYDLSDNPFSIQP